VPIHVAINTQASNMYTNNGWTRFGDSFAEKKGNKKYPLLLLVAFFNSTSCTMDYAGEEALFLSISEYEIGVWECNRIGERIRLF
jgi:hypothetical protein